MSSDDSNTKGAKFQSIGLFKKGEALRSFLRSHTEIEKAARVLDLKIDVEAGLLASPPFKAPPLSGCSFANCSTKSSKRLAPGSRGRAIGATRKTRGR